MEAEATPISNQTVLAFSISTELLQATKLLYLLMATKWPLCMHLAGTPFICMRFFWCCPVPASLSWALKIQRTNTEMLFIYQYSSCAICRPWLRLISSISCHSVLYVWVMQLHTGQQRWVFLRASHESASFLKALCWHILKTDTHISQEEANKSCMWHLFLFLPQRALHEAMLQLSLLILWPCWGGLTTLLTGTFTRFTVLRLSNNPANEGIHSLIPLSLRLSGPAALFSLLTFFYFRQANHFDSPISLIIL